MELTIKTDVFKEMVARAVKGASQNKLIPLTSFMAISLKNNELTLITTDMTNYLYIKNDKVVGDDFYAVVQVEQFSKLVGRMTCENVELEVDNAILKVKGNGDYKIELPLDEEGNTIVFPDPMANELTDGKDINITTIKTILNTIKPALAITMEMPVYTRYYMGDRVVATDTYKVASMNTNVLQEEPLLISAELMNLLDVMTCEKIQFHKNEDILIFSSPDCVVYGHTMEGIEMYAIDSIVALLDTKFPSSCKLNKAALLAVLDRISLFVGQYDNKGITLTFTDKGVDISSKSNSGIETLEYLESNDFAPYTCQIDIEMFIQQIKANTAEVLELHYGNEGSLKFIDGDITQIIALLSDTAK